MKLNTIALLKTVGEFRGVESGGWDQYDVYCERGTSRWRILLSADDKIASAILDWDRPNSAVGKGRQRL
jgi:hypothetical protein